MTITLPILGLDWLDELPYLSRFAYAGKRRIGSNGTVLTRFARSGVSYTDLILVLNSLQRYPCTPPK